MNLFQIIENCMGVVFEQLLETLLVVQYLTIFNDIKDASVFFFLIPLFD